MKKTLRLTFPQWQGGVNPDYVFGSRLLAAIAPPDAASEHVTVSVCEDFFASPRQLDGIDYGEALLEQARAAENILGTKQPDRVIVFGGDCAVTQIPFAYLGQKYGDDIGILWLDAHPDCATVKESSHLHEMVMGNLIGLSPDSEITAVKHPYTPDRVLLAGLIEEDLRPMDMACKQKNIRIASPESLKKNSDDVLSWIADTKIRYLAVHWDLDVLSPYDFRSIYPAEPYTNLGEFPAAVGRMTLEEIGRILKDASANAEIVGLSITEHLPWDAFRLQKTLNSISIFSH